MGAEGLRNITLKKADSLLVITPKYSDLRVCMEPILYHQKPLTRWPEVKCDENSDPRFEILKTEEIKEIPNVKFLTKGQFPATVDLFYARMDYGAGSYASVHHRDAELYLNGRTYRSYFEIYLHVNIIGGIMAFVDDCADDWELTLQFAFPFKNNSWANVYQGCGTTISTCTMYLDTLLEEQNGQVFFAGRVWK